jgi:hypothetical protein
MSFSTKGLEFKESEKVSNWLKPLTAHVAMMNSVEFIESKTGTPGMKITFTGKPMPEVKDGAQKAETTFWLSEKARDYTMQ